MKPNTDTNQRTTKQFVYQFGASHSEWPLNLFSSRRNLCWHVQILPIITDEHGPTQKRKRGTEREIGGLLKDQHVR